MPGIVTALAIPYFAFVLVCFYAYSLRVELKEHKAELDSLERRLIRNSKAVYKND